MIACVAIKYLLMHKAIMTYMQLLSHVKWYKNVSTCHLLRFDKTLTMSFNFLKMKFSNSISINLKRTQAYCFLYNPMSNTSEQHNFKSLPLIRIILLGKLRMVLNKNQKVPIFFHVLFFNYITE